jgi:hypothetical protein
MKIECMDSEEEGAVVAMNATTAPPGARDFKVELWWIED